MARPLRLEIENGLYHVFARGIEKKQIFCDPNDFQKFLNIFELAIPKYKISIYAFGLLYNHYHLLLRTATANLHSVMHYINTSYAGYFNYKYNRVGPLFQGRYKSILIENEQYLLELTRYIHLQATKKGIVINPAEYKWTSYRSYILGEKSFVEKDCILDYFGSNEQIARKEYQKFIEDKIASYDFEPFEVAYKGVILGSPQYIEEIKKENLSNLKLSKDILHCRNLKEIYCKEKIIEAIKKYYGITDNDLRSKKKKLTEYQKVVIYFLKKYTGLKLTEISEICGVHYVVVSRIYKKMCTLKKEDCDYSKTFEKIEKIVSQDVQNG